MWVRSNADTLFNIADASKVEVKATATSDGPQWSVTANFSRTPDGAKTSTYARNNPDEVHIFRGESEVEAREVFALVQEGFVKKSNFLDVSQFAQIEE